MLGRELRKRIRIGVIIGFLVLGFILISETLFSFLMLAILVVGIIEISFAGERKNNLLLKIIGIIPLTIFVLCNILLIYLYLGKLLMLLSVLTATISDTAGYLIGTAKIFGEIGRTKIFPNISPNKTWRGTIGAILIPFVLIILIMKYRCNYPYLLALILPLSAVFGDVLESILKRKLGIKDFSKLLDAHGGVLDRVDSHLFVGFILFLLIVIFGFHIY